jgi:hypothetical protein
MESSLKSSGFSLVFFLLGVLIPFLSIFTKGPEFYTWLVEERKINPETISKDQNKKEFAKYVEDYNTGVSIPRYHVPSHNVVPQ